MKLTRLQELTESKARLVEATKHDKAFAGIQSIVDDALGDLSDKLGKGGSLSTLFKESGASKLDTIKDDDGKNIVKQIVDLTTTYKKAIEKLMTEAEMLVMQVNEGKLLEAKDYSDSGDFTDEFYGLFEHVNKMKAAMKNPRWMNWMKITDTNFGTDTTDAARGAITALNDLEVNLNDIDAEFDKAN